MNKNNCTDYFTELESVSCVSTCCGVTGQFISNYPQITRIYGSGALNVEWGHYQAGINFSGTVTVRGYNFNNTKHVFLSASNMALLTPTTNVNPILTSCDFYSHVSSISSIFTSFSGHEVLDHTIVDNNRIEFMMPALSAAAIVNVIIAGRIGHNIPFIEEPYHQIHIK